MPECVLFDVTLTAAVRSKCPDGDKVCQRIYTLIANSSNQWSVETNNAGSNKQWKEEEQTDIKAVKAGPSNSSQSTLIRRKTPNKWPASSIESNLTVQQLKNSFIRSLAIYHGVIFL